MTRIMIFEFLTSIRSTVLLFLLLIGLSGCEFFALSFAPGKEPLENNSELANQASKVFWETLHQGDYSNISKPMTLLKAAYLQNPYYAEIAARIGFLHAWSLTERQRLKNIPPQITDNAILARKYFEVAVRLNPEDARYLGFHSSMMMSEESIHKDAYLTRKGYFQGLDSIESWPQFNLFTIGYTMSSKNIPILNSVKPLTCDGKISISASMTPSIEIILISPTILKWNLLKNGNLIGKHAGIHGLPPIICRDSS